MSMPISKNARCLQSVRFFQNFVDFLLLALDCVTAPIPNPQTPFVAVSVVVNFELGTTLEAKLILLICNRRNCGLVINLFAAFVPIFKSRAFLFVCFLSNFSSSGKIR